jgi:hypothetical protein
VRLTIFGQRCFIEIYFSYSTLDSQLCSDEYTGVTWVTAAYDTSRNTLNVSFIADGASIRPANQEEKFEAKM